MKIAIASCIKLQQTNPQPVWLEILTEKPDVVVLLGDTVYLEHDRHTDPERLQNELRGLYAKQFAEPNFLALREDLDSRNAKLLAIYDDHDFLGNNRYGGDHDPALREAARGEFARAFELNTFTGDVYQVVHTGLVDIVILDQRFYRSAPDISKGSRDAILGANQWTWFEQVVKDSTAKFLMVAFSTTLHTFGDESWEDYPGAFSRMRELLQKKRGAFIASGDVHRNALYDDSGVVEVVTSAVARHGIVFGAPRKNYGILTFSDEQMRVQLRSLKSGWRFDVTLDREAWSLDAARDAAHTAPDL